MEIVVVVLRGIGVNANISRVVAFFPFISMHLPNSEHNLVVPLGSFTVFHIRWWLETQVAESGERSVDKTENFSGEK